MMLELPGDQNWMVWGVGLMLVFPVLVVALSELSFELSRRSHFWFQVPLDLFRNTTLFLIFVSILLRVIVGFPASHLAVRVVDTALWITVINLALAFFNAVFFSGGAGTWRARIPKLLVDLCRLFIVLVAGAFVISRIWDVDLRALLAALGVGSLVIGLAMQETLGNLFSGIAVVSTGEFVPGDWIKVGEIAGQVRSVNWRSVTIATPNGDLIIIPNGQISRERLLVFGGDTKCFGLTIDFKIENSEPPQAVLDLIKETAAMTSGVHTEPQPRARILSYDDFDVSYRAVIFIGDYSANQNVRTEFLANFWYAAARKGISLPIRPRFGEHLDRATPARRAASGSAPAQVAEKLAALGTFQRSSEKLAAIAGDCRIELYRSGQALIKSGEESSRFYVITTGRAAAYLVTESRELIEEFSPGEMVLYKAFFRGGRCPFDVEATSDLEAISVPVKNLEEFLTSDPGLAANIERLLGLREHAAGRIAKRFQADYLNGDGETSRVDILRDMFRA